VKYRKALPKDLPYMAALIRHWAIRSHSAVQQQNCGPQSPITSL